MENVWEKDAEGVYRLKTYGQTITISELNSRLSDLESEIEQVNDTLMSYPTRCSKNSY